MSDEQMLWAICCFFIGGLFWMAGCIQMLLAQKAGERCGYARGEHVGHKQGDLNGYARGVVSGFQDGKKQGYEKGVQDAQPLRASNGWFVARPK